MTVGDIVDTYHRSCLRYIIGIRWFDRIRCDVGPYKPEQERPHHHNNSEGKFWLLGHAALMDDEVPVTRALQAHTPLYQMEATPWTP